MGGELPAAVIGSERFYCDLRGTWDPQKPGTGKLDHGRIARESTAGQWIGMGAS